MKTPFGLIQDTVIVPVYNFYNKYLGRNARNSCCNNIANFIFKYSQETDIIMLLCNAISVCSSHISQMNGLRKSNRENKDYLITQEKQEMGVDLALSIIPPFLINRFLRKKLESGAWTTKEAKDKLVNLVAPVVGASKDELYSTDHIRPISESIGVIVSKITSSILEKHKNLPKPLAEPITKLDTHIKSKLPDFATVFYKPSTEVIATDFDNMVREKRVSKKLQQKLRNGSAYDELCGQTNGLLILATIGYLVLASNVIMPILKNKLSNRSYEKQLNEMGETKESIKRKKRFDSVKNPIIYENKEVFNIFTDNFKTLSTGKQENIFNIEKQKEPEKYSRTFNNFDTYNKIVSQSTGLRI